MIFSLEDQPGTRFTPLEIACEHNIDCWLVSHVTDQDLDLWSLEKWKAQKLTNSNIEKHMIHLRKLLSKYTQKTLQTAFFGDEMIFKGKLLYNSHNIVLCLKEN